MENIKKNNNHKNQYTIEKGFYSDMGSQKLTKKEIERIQQPRIGIVTKIKSKTG